MARALRVEKTILIRSDAATVFSNLTEAGKLSTWFADRVSEDIQNGSLVEFAWGKGREARKGRARVLRVDPGRSIMLRWENGFSHSPDDYFSLTIHKRPKGHLEVTVVDFATKDAQEELEEIWDDCLDRLKETCEAS